MAACSSGRSRDVMESKRSWSVGRVPVGVERHLKTPNWKSRGFWYMGVSNQASVFAVPIAEGAMATDAIPAVVGCSVLGVTGDVSDMAFHANARFYVVGRELRRRRQRERQNRSSTQPKRPLPQFCPHVVPSLEIEVKSHQNFAGVEVGKRSGRKICGSGTVLMQPVVFVMPG